MLCNNAHSTEHVTDIDIFYTCIINGIQSVTKNVFHLNQLVKSFTQSLVRKECVKNNHAVARNAFWLWNFYRRPNQGQLYHSMKSSRAHLKFSFKFAKRIDDTAKADALANDRGAKNMINLGKELAK